MIQVIPAIRLFEKYNTDFFCDFKYVDYSLDAKESIVMICFLKNDRVAGISCIQQSPYEDKILWWKYLVVKLEYQNKGIATKLIETTFEYVKPLNKTLELSTYTFEGRLKLKPIIDAHILLEEVKVIYSQSEFALY